MKNIKDITISIFAIIGFIALVSGFTNKTETQETHSTPESHIWEMHSISDSSKSYVYAINKVTGEVRKYDSYYNYSKAGTFMFENHK